jgi:hypothetical protein
MENLGLRNLMSEAHGHGPATHIRGTMTIDGVFVSSGIHMNQGRYLPFEKSPSDHKWMLLDIPESAIIGKS